MRERYFDLCVSTSVARVAHVLLLCPISGNMDVNTLASKRAELIGNAEILRMRSVIHKNSTCVCLRLPVAAITQKRKNANVDLWPALGCLADHHHKNACTKLTIPIIYGSSKCLLPHERMRKHGSICYHCYHEFRALRNQINSSCMFFPSMYTFIFLRKCLFPCCKQLLQWVIR